MPFTRDANLNFNNATKIIHNKPQTFEEDCLFESDIQVNGSFSIGGGAPAWFLSPWVFSDTVTLDGAGALGNLTTDNGDITATAGNIEATAGTITAGSDIATTSGDVLVPAGNVTVGTGNVAIATAGNFSSLSGDLDLTAGNVDVTTGHVRVTTGNIQTTTGNVTVGTGNVAVTTGHLQTATGDIKVTTAGNISTLLGDITATNGDIYVTQGNLSVLNTVPGTDGNVTVGRMIELLSNAAPIAPAAAGGTLTNDTGELVWRVGTVEQSVTRTGISTKVGAVGTAGAVATALTGTEYSVAEGHIVTFDGIVHGVATAAGTAVSGRISGSVTRAAGGHVVIVAPVAVWTETSNSTGGAPLAALGVDATPGTDTMFINVTGVAGTAYTWHGYVNVIDTVL